MKHLIKILSLLVVFVVVLSFTCVAEIYQSDFPSYCPNSGGAYAEVQTAQGRSVFVVPNNYIYDTFSFYGNSGYNIMNCTSGTISGKIYLQNNSSFYGNGKEYDIRFASNGTLEVNEPYNNNGRVAYRWTSLSTSKIYNTNIGFLDNFSDRQNNDFIYTKNEKINIIIVVLISAILVYFLLGRCWHA